MKEPNNSSKLEIERLELEKQRLESENSLKQAELDFKRDELKAKVEGERKNIWFSSPLVVAGLSAVFGLLGTGVGAALQGYWNSELERRKFEFTLIQKALEPKEKTEAAKNLKFLVDAGLIQTLDSRKIAQLADNPAGLPSFSDSISVHLSDGLTLREAIQFIAQIKTVS